MRFAYNHLYYFWAVAHERNLTRAAQRLRVSQSAVSLQIRQLERSLGHELFERSGRRLILTEAGRIALRHADEIFALGTALVSELRGRGEGKQRVRIGALATLSRNFQLAFVRPLVGQPDVELDLVSGTYAQLLDELLHHRLDVVLTNALPPSTDGPWITHTLDSQPVSLIGPQAHAHRWAGRSIEDLVGSEPLILPGPQSTIRAGFDAWMDRAGINPHVAAEVDDMAMLRLLAREGAGLAVVPPIVVRDELAQGSLVEVSRLELLEEVFFAVTISRRFRNSLIADLIVAQTRLPGPQLADQTDSTYDPSAG